MLPIKSRSEPAQDSDRVRRNASHESVATKDSSIFVVRGQVGVGARDTEVDGALVSHGE